MAGLVQLQAPSSEPVTPAEMTAQLRLDTNDEQELIGGMIAAVRGEVELYLGRQLLGATYELSLDAFPSDGKWIELPFPPLISVTDIDYYNTSDVQIGLAATEFETDNKRSPGVIRLKEGKSWPATKEKFNAVAISYTAGYASAAVVPAAIKLAIRELVAHHYRHREPILTGTIETKLDYSVERALRLYRVDWPMGLPFAERVFVKAA